MRSLGTFDNAESMKLASVEFVGRLRNEARTTHNTIIAPVKFMPATGEPYTAKDDALIRRMRDANASLKEIAEVLNRTQSSVGRRAMRLGLTKRVRLATNSGQLWGDGGAV